MNLRVWAFLACTSVLTGCALRPDSTISTGTSTLSSAAQLNGIVHGGQQPVTGSTIQLWQVGTTGYGSSATLLATTTTDGNGSFSITGAYTCPSGNPLVYITATGGNPGLVSGTNNSAILLIAPLGQCNALTSTTFIVINEVTTVAAAYALSQFMTTSGSIGTYSSASTGLVNGFTTFNNLASFSTGAALSTTPNGNGVPPQQEINTLANILVPCVNSTSASSSNCTALFGYTGGFTVLAAALSMAQAPTSNVTNLYNLSTANATFQPALTATPTDFSVDITYATGGTVLTGIAIDSKGNLWTANNNNGGSASSVSMFTPGGVPATNSPISSSSNINGVNSIAIDTNNNVWITNHDNNSAQQFSSSYSSGSGRYTINTGYGPLNGIGLSGPKGIAIDGNNNIWIANSSGNSLQELNSTGNTVASAYTGAGLNGPTGVAVDSSGNIWVTNTTGASFSEFSTNGSAITGTSGYVGPSVPYGIAIDASNNIWATDSSASKGYEFGNNGTQLSGSPFNNGGIATSFAVAIDGNNRTWYANFGANTVSEFSAAGTAVFTSGLSGAFKAARAIAIDQSGNVWVANGSPVTVNGALQTVVEIVGAAAPTIAPLSAAVSSGQIGTKPGTPVPVTLYAGTLPYYEASVAYQAKVSASGGNSGTFTYALTSGSLPTGLNLNTSTGLISGTTAATGTYPIQITACDATRVTNCSSATSFSVASTNTLAARGNESALNGSYAIRYSGYRNSTGSTGAVYGEDFVGSLHFNGSGSVTTGEVDIVTPNSSSITTASGVTGVYQLGSDNRGILILTPTGANPLELAFSVSNFSSGVAQNLQFIEFDDTNATTGGSGGNQGGGLGKLQTAAAFANGVAALNGTYVIGYQGETACTNYNNTNSNCPQTIAPFGPVSGAGYFVGNGSGSITSGQEDIMAVGTNYAVPSHTGSYSTPDTTYGRGTLTLNSTTITYPGAPTNFVYYVVNSAEIFFMSAVGHLSNAMVEGDAVLQSPGVFSASNPNPLGTNSYVAYSDSPSGGDGVSTFPTQTGAQIIQLVASGTSLTATQDVNKAGIIQTNVSLGSLTYSVDAHGRMTFTGGSGTTPIFYFANLTQAFGTEQGTSGDNPGLYFLQQQTGGPFSASSLNGTYSVGVLPPPALLSTTSGTITSAGSASGTSILDLGSTTGNLTFGQTGTFTTTNASTGRTTVSTSTGNTNIFWFISPTQGVMINGSGSNTATPIFFIQK